jgi:hypothetical protein
MKHILWAIAGVCLLAAPASAQSPGTVNLVGPSGGGQKQITPKAINDAVNAALMAKQDYPVAFGSLTLTDGTHTVAPIGQIIVTGAVVGGTTPNATLTISPGSSVTWPATASLLLSNGTDSPAGLAPINGDCVIGSGGLWVAGPCPGGGGISGPGTTVSGAIPVWNGVGGTALGAGITLGSGVGTALGQAVTGSGGIVLATSPSITLPNATGLPLTTGVTGILPKANGGTGTATPGLVAGTNVTITGTWPNQTINAIGGSSVSLTAATTDLVVSPNPITGTGTIGTQTLLNTQTGSSYAILTSDNNKVVEMTNAAATTMTIAVAGSAGFGADWGATILATLAPTKITPASGTICGLPSVTVTAQTPISLASDNVSNYVCAKGVAPTAGTLNAGTTVTLAAPEQTYVCTGVCTVTPPTPAPGYKFCILNDNNVATAITLAAISGVSYQNTNFTSYKSANTSIVSSGAAGDRMCILGRDATHYLVQSFIGSWS